MAILLFWFDQWKKKILELCTVLGTSTFLAYLVLKYEIKGLAIATVILVLAVILIYQLSGSVPYEKTLFLIPLIVCSLPLQRFFLTTIVVIVAAQFMVFPVIVSYVVKFPAGVKREYAERVRPLIFPTIAFAFVFILAYIASGAWTKADWGFILSLLGSLGYAYLACVYCRDFKSFQRILWVLIGIGVIQLPVMYAMGRGWTNHLPGAFSKLSSESWGGMASADGLRALRYPGLFRDYELLAEYLGLMVLFCLGITLSTTSKREHIISILAAVFVTVAGFYTGTRAFAIGLGVGSVVVVILLMSQSALRQKLKTLALLGTILVFAFYLLSTQEIFKGYMDRLLKTDIRLGYYDSRTDVWKKSFAMMEDLPFTGYGTQMTRMFENIGYTSPHSLYFSMFLKAGYPGIFALFILIITPFLWMSRVLLDRASREQHIWAIVLLSSWMLWAVNEIKIEFIRYPFYMNIVFFMFGMFAGFYQLALRKPADIRT